MTPDPPATEDVFGQLATTWRSNTAPHTARAMTATGNTSTARKEEVDNFVAVAGTRADR
jgi:hypothetical protein